MKDLIKKIKQKKELSDISDDIVEEELVLYAQRYKINLITLNKKELSIVVSEIREKLRGYTGRFQSSKKNIQKRLELLKSNKIKELLKTHSSTKERLAYYPKLITLIRKFRPESILDLGCGLNPTAIASKFPNTHYHALDI